MNKKRRNRLLSHKFLSALKGGGRAGDRNRRLSLSGGLDSRPREERERERVGNLQLLIYTFLTTTTKYQNIRFLNHESSILRQSSNPVCGF